MNQIYIKTVDIERCNTTAFDDNLREIQDVYAQFEQLGIPTVSSSRINTYRDAFESLRQASKEKRRPDLSLATLMLHTMVEFAQLRTIVKAAMASPERISLNDQLGRLISGTSVPTPLYKHSPAHDFQFESFLGAVAELSGYKVNFAEPDIIVQCDTYTFGIAAKRPRSKRAVEKNCRKAASQIRQSGLPGIIALEMSFALYPNQCINTNDLAGSLAFIQAAANKFVGDYYHTFRKVCRDDSVLGVFVCLQLPVLNFGHPVAPQLATAVRWLLAPYCEPHDERLRWILEFAAKCELGLFGPPSTKDVLSLNMLVEN